MDLQAQIRNVFGKKTRNLRKQGFVPAEVYGKTTKNIHLSVKDKEFKKVFKESGESALVNLIIDKDNFPVYIHQIQRDPLSKQFLSIDFLKVEKGEKVKVNVPLEFINSSEAVKKGGELVKNMHEMEVEGTPENIPPKIKVDISQLKNIGDHIKLSDLNISKNIAPLLSPETIIVSVKEAKEEEVEEKPVETSEETEKTPEETSEENKDKDKKRKEIG